MYSETNYFQLLFDSENYFNNKTSHLITAGSNGDMFGLLGSLKYHFTYLLPRDLEHS